MRRVGPPSGSRLQSFHSPDQYWLAFCVLAIGGINDILYARRVVDTAYIAPYTFIAFVLMQASLIAQKFARVFEERDASQNALLETYQQLDDELLKREKLVAANERLSEENRIASEQLIQADKLATLGTMVAGSHMISLIPQG